MCVCVCVCVFLIFAHCVAQRISFKQDMPLPDPKDKMIKSLPKVVHEVSNAHTHTHKSLPKVVREVSNAHTHTHKSLSKVVHEVKIRLALPIPNEHRILKSVLN